MNTSAQLVDVVSFIVWLIGIESACTKKEGVPGIQQAVAQKMLNQQ
jgi:hypothetical protein